jgi:hypothetical protein
MEQAYGVFVLMRLALLSDNALNGEWLTKMSHKNLVRYELERSVLHAGRSLLLLDWQWQCQYEKSHRFHGANTTISVTKCGWNSQFNTHYTKCVISSCKDQRGTSLQIFSFTIVLI